MSRIQGFREKNIISLILFNTSFVISLKNIIFAIVFVFYSMNMKHLAVHITRLWTMEESKSY